MYWGKVPALYYKIRNDFCELTHKFMKIIINMLTHPPII